MKKFVYIIVSVFIVVLGLLIFENQYADERIKFTVENQNIEYSCSQLYFYNSIKGEYDTTADLLDTKTNIAAADCNSKISFKLSHKPLRIYELNPSDEKNERLKISYNKQDGCYYLSPLFDSEECFYNVVADYGFRKIVYNFVVFNKTYISDRYFNIADTSGNISVCNDLAPTKDVVATLDDSLGSTDYAHFYFSVKNNTNQPINCSFFMLEKQMNGIWYSVDERDVSYNQVFWDNYKQKFPFTIQPKENGRIEFPTALDALFDVYIGNDITSGIYRVVIPYTCNNYEGIALSQPFALGYVPVDSQ